MQFSRLPSLFLALFIHWFPLLPPPGAAAHNCTIPGLYPPTNDFGRHHFPANMTQPYFKPVSSLDLRRQVQLDSLMEHLTTWERFALAQPEGNRLAGGYAHNQTLDYIWRYLDATCQYYTLERQPIHKVVRVSSAMTVSIDDGTGEVTDRFGWSMTWSDLGEFHGELTLARDTGCDPDDYPEDVRGKLVLVGETTRQDCPFWKILRTATSRGVKGLILNPQFRPASCRDDWNAGIPAVMLMQSQGMDMWRLLSQGKNMTATITVHDKPCKEVDSYNIIATSKMGSEEDTIMLGAHTDSVAAGPGINDNGSGAAALLEIAVLLAKHRVQNRVRFAFWTMEESGLLGSMHWVASTPAAELARVRLYLNFDMIGSPNFKLGAYDGSGRDHGLPGPPGSEHPQALFDAFFAASGANASSDKLDGRSDYAPFLAVGIPAGGVFTGADALKTPDEADMFGGDAGEPFDANYHLRRDGVANVHPDALLLNARAIAHAVATYANDLDGVPRRAAAAPASARDIFDIPLVYGGGCGGHDHVSINEDLPPGGVRGGMGFGETWKGQ